MSNYEDEHDRHLGPEVRLFIEATRQAHLDERAAVLRFAPILCTCTRWYDWRNPEPPQLDCLVHTTIMLDQKGGWM